jgi:hypothetical protein
MATKKRTTKQQREAQQLAALHQRIVDVYSGASGGEWDESQEWPVAEQLAMIVPALRSIFGGDNVPDFVWDARNLDKFDEPRKIAEQLYAHGVRS